MKDSSVLGAGMIKGRYIVLTAVLLLFAPIFQIFANAADPCLCDYWKFDESNGTTAYDSAGNHNGTVHKTAWTPDSQFGNALDFNGIAYVDIGDINITGDWTVCFWAKSSDNTGTVYYPIGLGNPHLGIVMGGTSSSIAQHICVYDGSNILQSLTIVETGSWYHIAITKSATTYSIYVNGICESTGALSDIDLTNFKIGTRPDLFGGFNGIIDDVGVWDGVLPAGDINDPNPGTINYVRLNGISGPGYGIAGNPNPSNMQTNVKVNTLLSWRRGGCAADVNGHRLYLSKNFNDVNTRTAAYVELTEPNYNPSILDYASVYYWCVDEVNDPCVWYGRVWKFITEFGAVDPNLVSNWRFDKGSGSVAYDSVGPYNGVIYKATWTSDGRFDNALDFNGTAYVDIGNINITGDWTVCFWAKSSDNTGTVYYPIGLGDPRSGIIMGGTTSSVTQHICLYDGSSLLKSTSTVSPGNWYHIAVTRSGTTYSIYVNGVCEKTGTLSNIGLTDFKIGARPDLLGGFKGTIDDVGVWNCVLAVGDINDPNPGTINYVRLNGVSGPGYGVAWNPFPDDGQTGVTCRVELQWRPAANAAEVNEHRVYFSTDFNGVYNGTIPYVGMAAPNYTPGLLDINTTYYWRVDEVVGPNVWRGFVWDFTTCPGIATNPNPADNAQQVSPDIQLSWTPGGHVADINGHDVYFGTDLSMVESAVASGLAADIDGDGKVDFYDFTLLAKQWLNNCDSTTWCNNCDIDHSNTVDFGDLSIMAEDWGNNNTYKGRQTANVYDPCDLEFGVTYYWRVDECNGPNIWPGEVWSFTAGIGEPTLTNAPTYQTTPTYDGSGQAMHPGIVYLPDGWNGYKYWMSMTPLTWGNSNKENPSILASNDGFSWQVPPGLNNPIIGMPSGGYNADPEIVYNDDTNELWVYFLRYWSDTNDVNLALMKSSDGVCWTGPEYLLKWHLAGTADNERSYAVVKQGSNWYYWAQTYDASHNSFVCYRSSTDGRNWSSPSPIVFSPTILLVPWHLDVIYVPTKSEYWMLYSAPGSTGGSLYLAKSRDRLNWVPGANKVLSPSTYGWDNYMLYRPTLLYDSNSQLLRVWYSANNAMNEWHTGYTETEY